jgi:hypothetical protein
MDSRQISSDWVKKSNDWKSVSSDSTKKSMASVRIWQNSRSNKRISILLYGISILRHSLLYLISDPRSSHHGRSDSLDKKLREELFYYESPFCFTEFFLIIAGKRDSFVTLRNDKRGICKQYYYLHRAFQYESTPYIHWFVLHLRSFG